MKKKFTCLIFFLAGISLFAGNETNKAELKEQAQHWMQNQSVKFLENKGQMSDMEGKPVPFVLFKAEAPGMNMYITEKGITYVFVKGEEEREKKEEAHPNPPKGMEDSSPSGRLGEAEEENITRHWARVDMELKNANIKKENIIKESESVEHFNYFYGHCPEGIYDVKQYEKITIKDIYPGIDWVMYNSNEKGFKYDFVVHPGADYKTIELLYRSKLPLHINEDGALEIKTAHGDLKENAPVSFYEGKTLATRFIKNFQNPISISGDDGYETSISFNLSVPFPASHPGEFEGDGLLIIDPQLVWGTFYGGTQVGGTDGSDGPMSADTDNNDNLYVTGYTFTTDFPVCNICPGYFDGILGKADDAFILKFDNAGVRLWATFYGGSADDYGMFITIDVFDNVFVTGWTGSNNFPCSSSGTYFDNTFNGLQDVFILKFNNTGVLLWATYFGGSGYDIGISLATDGNGNLFVTGGTSSTNFPIQNAFQGANAGGSDAFILKFSNAGVLLWATYYGGSLYDDGHSIATDGKGDVLVTGLTASTNFPTLNPSGGTYFQGTYAGGAYDTFILKFNNPGVLLWATYYGGGGYDMSNTIAVDVSGNIFVMGYTESPNFPVCTICLGYFDGTLGGVADAFILKFDNAGIRLWATYYGGSNREGQPPFFLGFDSYDNLVFDECGNIYLSFKTSSANLPTQNSCPSPSQYYDTSLGGGKIDAFTGLTSGDIALVHFDNTGNRLWATYLGGNSNDYREALAIDGNNNLFVVGEWTHFPGVTLIEATYPLINPSGGAYYDPTFGGLDDGYIVKFTPVLPTYTQLQNNNTSCSPCNGTATINVNCGNPNYSYTWSNGSSTLNTVSTTNTLTGLCPGTYTVTATSNCNQTQTTTFTITGTACGGITATVNSATICGGVPCPTLIATGASGTAPYTYLWNTTATTTNITPCPASTTNYTVTVTDNLGVTATAVSTITVNLAVSATITATNISCNGTNNGSVTATGAGGSPAFTYTWSAPGGSASTLSGLSAGNYTVTITDNKGCTSISTAAIISPPPLTGQFTKGMSNCTACGCKEWIMITATGGTSPYTYTWPDGYVNRYKNKLCPGAYTINITDKKGCNINIDLNTP